MARELRAGGADSGPSQLRPSSRTRTGGAGNSSPISGVCRRWAGEPAGECRGVRIAWTIDTPMERAMPDMTLVLITAGAIVAGLLTIAFAILGRIKSAARLLITERLDLLHRDQDRIERSIRDEIAKDREERATSAKQLREELR